MAQVSSQSVFSGMFWKFMERISAQLTSFVVSVVLARILLPEDYGTVAMVIVFINIANVFVTSGLSTALIQKKDATELDFSTIFYCTLVLSIFIYIILFIAAPYIATFYNRQELTSIIRVFSIKVIISSYNSVQHAYVSKHLMFKKFFYSTLIGTIVSGIVGIILALSGAGTWAIVAQYLVNSTIDTIVLAFTVPWCPHYLFSMKAAKPLVRYGWKVLAADLIGTIYNNIRSLLIGKFYSSSDLAFYNKGKQFPELVCNNIDTTISSVLFPAMSNYGDVPAKIKALTRKSIQVSSYVIFPIMVGLAAVAKPLITILLTEKWIEAVPYLQILCIAYAINTISNANLQAMRALGRSDVVLKLEFIKKPIGLMLVLISIKFGVLWIAISLPVYYLIATIINMRPNFQLMSYSLLEQIKDISHPVIFSLVMYGCVAPISYLKIPEIGLLFLQIILGVSVYLILSLVFKDPTYEYLMNMMKSKICFHKKD